MYINRRIKFFLYKRKAGQVTDLDIRMRVTVRGRSPIDFPLGLKVDLDKWDTDAQRAISGQPKEINREIDEYRVQINEVFERYELLEKRIPTAQEIRGLFNELIGKTQYSVEEQLEDFWSVYDLFVREIGTRNQWTKETYIKFSALRKDIEKFSPKISIRDINDNTMQLFVQSLIKKGLKNTTIDGKLTFFKWFLRWASQNGYYYGKSHETYRPKIKGVDASHKEIIYLSRSEIKTLQEHRFGEGQKHLEQVRDVLLFCCFTGLRYSDAFKLTKSDIKNGSIRVVTQKTSDGLIIELNKYSSEILDKYKNVNIPDNKALPVISNQKMNEYLKALGQVCGLDDPQRVVYFIGNKRHEEVYPKWALLTTHCGRRSFVVNALMLGIPVEVVMKWTGHSDYDAMKPYIAIVDELKKREMAKFDLF